MGSRRFGATAALLALAMASLHYACATGTSDSGGATGSSGGSGDMSTSGGSGSALGSGAATGSAAGSTAAGSSATGSATGSSVAGGSTTGSSASGSSGTDTAGSTGMSGTGSGSSGSAASGGATGSGVTGSTGIRSGSAGTGSAGGSGGGSGTSGSGSGSGTIVSSGTASHPMPDGGLGDASCAASQIVDYCNSIPPLPAAPVIDGIADCGPMAVTMAPQGWSGAAPLPPFPAGNSAVLAAAWRPDGLYVFVAVTTPAAFPANPGAPPYQGAAVEVYVDSTGTYPNAPMYNNPGTIQIIAEAPPGASSPGKVAEKYRNAADQGSWQSTQFGTFQTPSGFNFEAFVSAADLGLSTWALASGSHIGFDISVDVSYSTATMTGADGHRVGQYFLHVGGALPYADPRSFCRSTLTSQ